jgi:hypothetical protein
MRNIRLFIILLIAAALLSIPAFAKLFTAEMKWDGVDFLVMGVLLFGTGIACEIALRILTKTTHRLVACALILAGLFVIWAEIAVGIFGTPFAGS